MSYLNFRGIQMPENLLLKLVLSVALGVSVSLSLIVLLIMLRGMLSKLKSIETEFNYLSKIITKIESTLNLSK